MLMGAAKIAPAKKWINNDDGEGDLMDLRHGAHAYGRGGRVKKGLRANGWVVAEGEPSRGLMEVAVMVICAFC